MIKCQYLKVLVYSRFSGNLITAILDQLMKQKRNETWNYYNSPIRFSKTCIISTSH